MYTQQRGESSIVSFFLSSGSSLPSSTARLICPPSTANCFELCIILPPNFRELNSELFESYYSEFDAQIKELGDPAKEVFKDALQDLMVMCQHVRGTFDKAVVDFRESEHDKEMKMDS